MDSCSSSPSHSFKDRPRSHHGDVSRHASSPRSLERGKSPAGKGVAESRDASVGPRDPTRRGYGDCGAEKNGGDGALSNQDRSRTSLRRPFGLERQRDSKAEMHRSVRSCGISINFERESGETGGRLDIKRSSHGDASQRLEMSEGRSGSPLQTDRELIGCKAASHRGYEKEAGDGKWSSSASPEVETKEPSKSPISGKRIMKTESKEVMKGSPKRHVGLQTFRKEMAPDKEYTLNLPVKKEATERGKFSPPRKGSAREVHDDADAASTKKKHSKFRDLDKLKEQEVSSSETEAGAWNKGLLSRPREDMFEGEQLHESKSLQEDDCRENPVSFLHVSKRARSDRERVKRDEHTGKSTARYLQWSEFAKTDSNKVPCMNVLDRVSPVKKGLADDKESNFVHEAKQNEESYGTTVEASVVHANKMSLESLEKECLPPTNGANSDMEEGELEPESDTIITPDLAAKSMASAKKGEDIKKETCTGLVNEPKGKELCEGQFKADDREEDKLVGDEISRHADGDNKNSNVQENPSPSLDKKEAHSGPLETESASVHSKDKNLQIFASNILELGESSRAGVLFDLLGTKTETNNRNLSSETGTNIESSKELTLSLFTNPSQTAGEGSQSKEGKYPKESNGKHTVKLQSSDAGGGEESSQLSGRKQKKLKLESLQLSLALPGSSNIAGVLDSSKALAEPSRSFQSLNQTQTHTQNFLQSQTNSDGFSSSFSFSQSESFIHNPSCSLNCTSFENQELSCGGTRQLSQGTEYMSNRSLPALSGNEHGMHTVTSMSHDKSKHRRGIPLYQRVLQNGSMHQGFPSVTGSNRSSGSNQFSQKSFHHGQRLQGAPKILDSSSQDLDGSVRQVTTNKDIMERIRQQKAWFASKQQAMSAEPHRAPSSAQDRDKPEDPPSANVKGILAWEKDIAGGERTLLSEKIGLHEITVDPIAIMAQKLQELPDSFLEGLKGVARGVLSSFEKREDFLVLQENIRRRKDLTEDSLLRAHRTQLEILVALKTGCQSFVEEKSKPQTYKVLIEIFLETRCRNVACQQPLLVYECGCKVCPTKSGFCRECMCVVCFKFDLDYSTCRWLGCDICEHWCHTDCALRMSYIAPTLTDKNTNGTTEMQYHCVACDHKSELHGFVKDVFQNCAENWNAETLAKELDCVRKIFHGSDDMKGKQLCWQAEQMLQELENKIDATEVCRTMLRYLNEGNAELDGACGPIKKPSSISAPVDILGHMSEPAREYVPKSSASCVIKLPEKDNARVVLPKFERNSEEKRTEAAELQYDRARKKAEIEDMESDIRIKQAEAKMFQIRADDARQEVGGLERIISVKKEKVDEEYAAKYAKLRVSEAEERYQKRFEELKTLEIAQQDFQKMKLRMEAKIKELMVKMEMAKRQFA